MNKLQSQIKIEKVTLNMGVGKEPSQLDKSLELMKYIIGKGLKPVKTTTSKRIQGWGLRPGLPIGCKITLRGKKAKEILIKLLYAKDNVIPAKKFDKNGNFAFGVNEYIDIKDVKYNPDFGIKGLEVAVTLEKPGYRVKKRSRNKTKVGKKHLITKQEGIDFIKKEFNIKIIEA